MHLYYFTFGVTLHSLQKPRELLRQRRWNAKMASSLNGRSQDFHPGLNWTEEMLYALSLCGFEAPGRALTLSRVWLSELSSVKESRTVPIFTMEPGLPKSHVALVFCHNRITLTCSVPGCLVHVCVQAIGYFCQISDQQFAIRPKKQPAHCG